MKYRWLLAICVFLLSGLGRAEELPEGMLFIGLKAGQWRIHVRVDGGLKTLDSTTEPRTATLNRARGVVAYIGADGKLREIGIRAGSDRVLLASDKARALTQPAYSPSGRKIYVVSMEGGASAETDIIALNAEKNEPPVRITQQPGAQFEPRAMGEHGLLYSSVSCSLGCGRIIQEVWHKNLLSDRAEQLTLINTISRQPSPSKDREWIYFSSDAAAHYHIWRHPTKGGPAQQITRGNATDINPTLDERGWVYFIRYEPNGTKLMRLDGEGQLVSVSLPEGVTDLRNLEIAP